ncbi:MAG: precorrin-4 C(11)-methyltransferase [Clostridia bacterium]|nr:MAG: precorrin-4 C(11)-methyltransferase [Clostridia bacterium]
MKVYFIGAGPGDPELMTLKARNVLEQAGAVIYAGSLVHPDCLKFVPAGVPRYDSSGMTLEEMVEVMVAEVRKNHIVARLHSGDASLYGAIAEQMRALDRHQISYEVIPGVSSFLAAAAALKVELTVPAESQTVILTRAPGRTPVPERESLASLAAHQATLCLFLSISQIDQVAAELLTAYPPDTPAAVVYKVGWPEEKIISGPLAGIAGLAKQAGLTSTALILVGDFLARDGQPSRLYAGDFAHSFRGQKPCE